MSDRLAIVPITLRDARTWVDRVHRHHRAPQGGLFAGDARMLHDR